VDALSLKTLLDSVEARLVLSAYEIKEDETARAEVEVRNAGNENIEFHGGKPLSASLLDPLTLASVGRFSGWIAGVGFVIRLAPGDTTRLPVLLGTHQSGPDVRVALPPGIFLGQVLVPIHTTHADDSGYDTNYVEAPLVKIRIIPNMK